MSEHPRKNDMLSKTRQMAWIIFAVVSVPYLLVYFHRVAPAVVADRLMAEFRISGAVLGSLSAIYFYIYTLMQVPAGIFSDSFGPKRTIIFGSVLSGIGSLVFASAQITLMAYLGRFLVGLGVSLIFIPILKICTEWFDPKKFAAMSGLTLLVGNTGALLASSPLALLAGHFGWRTGFHIIGGVGFIAAGLVWIIVRDRPSDLLLPSPVDGMMESKAKGFHQAMMGLGAVVTNPRSWPPFLAFFGIYGTLMAFQGAWGVAYLMQNYGMTRIEAANNVLPIAVGLIVGSPVIGYVSDRLNNRKIPFLCAGVVYLGTWAALLYWSEGKPSASVLVGLFFTMGFSASGFILSWAMGKEVNSPSLAGSAMGFTNMGGFLGAAIMQPLFGLLLDMNWQGQSIGGLRVYTIDGYQKIFMVAMAFICFSLVVILFTQSVRQHG